MESWNQINAVQQMQSYIESHLDEPITLLALSMNTGYSPWHCAKIFKELTGKTPFEYIRKYRLSKAALELRDSELKVIDVAMDFVFDSHEGFTRAFRKQFGINPNEYKRNTPPIYLFKPWPVREYYYWLKEEKTESQPVSSELFVQVRNFPKRKLIMKRSVNSDDYFSYIEEFNCDIWGLLCSIKEALYEPIGMWLPKSLCLPDTSCYAQGVEVPYDYKGEIPEGFEIIELPACKMLMFQSDAYDDIHFQEVITTISNEIKNYDPTSLGYQWDDQIAPRFQLDPQGWRGYIEGRPVKELY